MIPLVGIPVLNRGDLLLRCADSLAGSSQNLVVVDNSLGRDESICEALTELGGRWQNSLAVLRPDGNLGVAGSWNFILRTMSRLDSNPHRWGLVCNNDMEFNEAAIGEIQSSMSRPARPDLLLGDHGFAWFGITEACVEKVGFFDENFYPAYFEDNDYHRRARLTGVNILRFAGPATIHGDAQGGSLTIRSEPRYHLGNTQTFPRNRTYYFLKWGGEPGDERHDRPFGISNHPLKHWELDKRMRAQNSWE